MPTRSNTARRRTIKPQGKLPRGSHRGVELLLVQSVDGLGKPGDVVEVRPGFANNFLLPQGMATVASAHHKRMVEKHRAKLAEIEQSRLRGLRDLAARIGQLSITIEANANDEGHLYGSVTANDINAALRGHDVHVSNDQIRMEGVLKELGLYTIRVHLHNEIESDLKVWVVPTVNEGART